VLFNSKPIQITNVAGLNDDLNLAILPGTCGTCHDSPDVGNHSVSAPLNIGVGDLNSPLDVSYLPVIALQNKTTLEIKTTTDPGRALITGLWKDVGRLKGRSSAGSPAARRISITARPIRWMTPSSSITSASRSVSPRRRRGTWSLSSVLCKPLYPFATTRTVLVLAQSTCQYEEFSGRAASL